MGSGGQLRVSKLNKGVESTSKEYSESGAKGGEWRVVDRTR